MNYTKFLTLTLAVATLKLGAFTDVEHINPAYTTQSNPGNIEIVVPNIPNMKKARFSFTITPDGNNVIIEGHSKKETDKTGEHTKLDEKYRVAFATVIALEKTIAAHVIRQKPYTYEDRKKAALNGVLIQKYIGNELRIQVPTVS